MYFLKLSGYIPSNKQLEFEQTCRFARTQIPGTCEEYNISKDSLNEGIYHFFSYWMQLSELDSFTQSAPFLIITGAFSTLGELYENHRGTMTKLFETGGFDTIAINQTN